MDWAEAFVKKYQEIFTMKFPESTIFGGPAWKIHLFPWTAVSLYYLMLCFLPGFVIKYFGKGYDKKKGLTTIDYIMFAWNLGLSIMSFIVLINPLGPWIYYHVSKGYRYTICNPDRMATREPSTMLFFGLVFTWSKYFELFDTVLIIIKKPEREVLFLHWYHHITVLIFSWYSNYYEFCMGFWAGMVNATVHTIMYFYYALTSLGYRPGFGKTITIIQTTQMVFGLFFSVSWAYYFFSQTPDNPCIINTDRVWTMVSAALVMYGSYLFLFLKFFKKRWGGRKDENVDEKVEAKKDN